MEPYPTRIIKAYSQVDAMGLVGYFRNLFAFMIAAGSLDELKAHWTYCYRVSDHTNPLFTELEQLKNRRKQELEQCLTT